MEDAITRAVRRIVREEIAAACRTPRLASSAPPPTVEMPLRREDVERHYPVAEVARLLGMSRDWVYERLQDGTFITANFGEGKSKKRIPASSIQAYINAHTY